MSLELIGTIGVVAFAVIGAWSLLDQAKKIWKNRSGEAVNKTWMVYFFFLYLSSTFYGLQTDKWPIIFHGSLRGIVVLLIVYGLWKFERFTKYHWLEIVALWFLIGLQVFTPYKGPLFLAISIGSIITASLQPVEMVKKKTNGVLSLPMLLIFLSASCFWTIYSIAITDWFLFSMSMAYNIMGVIVIALWFVYRK